MGPQLQALGTDQLLGYLGEMGDDDGEVPFTHQCVDDLAHHAVGVQQELQAGILTGEQICRT